MKTFISLLFLLIGFFSTCQNLGVHPVSNDYQKPTDPLVLQKLEHWQDQKFGIIIHWGLYSVPGIIESWSICSEDWISRDTNSNYGDYKNWYFGLKDSLNPTKFNPERWADISKKAGMRYLVFTTKHHDGFCMFDTKQTDFNIAKGPFAKDPRSDVLKYVFSAYRDQDFMIGAYFSKPDWHNENYWWPMYATPNRNNNYDIRKHPWRWKQFQNDTYNQIQEIVTGYGGVDILWLDGGWVRPKNTIDNEVLSWGMPIPEWDQELDIAGIAKMARTHQPGMIVVDRTVQGPYENYQTPEHSIPKTKINNPWETCMPLANNWGYVPNDPLKSSDQIIKTLVEVVAKGGNLLLGVGPKPDGTFSSEVETKLLEIGKWLEVNGSAVYGTRSLEHYQDGKVFFTQTKDEKTIFAFVTSDNSMSSIEWTKNLPKVSSNLIYVPTGESINYKIEDNKVIIKLSKKFKATQRNNPMWVFKFES